MCRKIVWCYVFLLTLLDFTINTKLSAQGKSHGVTVHDSLIEGITFQEWAKDSAEDVSDGAGAGASGGRAMAAGVLTLSPPALHFGAAQLAMPHTLVVTITNTANTTMHLASVAGTTPDFHASFFDAKTLAPQANTSFSVVYLGRREGPVSAHLYIHTSLGVHKYSVSAVGVASEWGVWPLVGVRVPLNATVEPLLTMYNPTDHTIQVSEVYSSGSWLGLQLPDGGAAAPKQAWLVPARSSAPLVRLKIALHHVHPTHQHHTHTAYVRIKANITGGGLVVCVEAKTAPPGEFATPVQLRLRTRGSEDPADVVDISAGNSAGVGVSVEASVWAARCSPTPYAPQAPFTHNGESKFTANGNGVKSDGVYVSLVRSYLEPHQHLTRTAQLRLDYAKMWAGYSEKGESTASAGAWCGGWVVVGRAAVPYSVRLLPGTLRLSPAALHLITSNQEEWLSTREVRVHNEFPVPVHIARIDYDDEFEKYLQIDSSAPMTIAGGGSEVVARVRLRGDAASLPVTLASRLLLRTNLTEYTLPVYVYSGQLDIEWEWPNSADGTLRLGGVGASSTRHVRARLHNRGVVALCVRELTVALPGAQVALPDTPPPPPTASQLSTRCVEAGGFTWAWLTVVAPARAGVQRGHVVVRAAPPDVPDVASPSPAAVPAAPTTRADVLLTVHHGRVTAHTLTLAKAAPYAWSTAALTLESTMDLTMRLQSITIPPDNPALMFQATTEPSTGEVTSGRNTVGTIVYAAEKLCEPDCYTGLDVNTTEGEAWLSRSAAPGEESLRLDVTQQAARYALYLRRARASERSNISLHLHTDHVVQIPVSGVVSVWWPRLAASSGDAGLVGVSGVVTFRIRVRNPSQSHSVLLQPVLAGPLDSLAGSSESPVCRTEKCVPALEAFRLVEWRATRGAVSTWRDLPPAPTPATADLPPASTPATADLPTAPTSANADLPPASTPATADLPPAPVDLPSLSNVTDTLPLLLLAPDAEIELKLTFAPKEAAALTAYLYLRNNLTIMEGVQLSGRGAYPSFELGGRRPGTNSPLLFEVSECVDGGVVGRSVLLRNTGRVRVRLREWRVAGEACAARGFTLTPCAPITLAPNESRPLAFAFAPDWTLARVGALLSLRSELGRAAFPLAASVPAHVLARCAAAAPRPPWEGALRAAGSLLALAALALVLAAAALDAERELRRARAARPPPAPAARQPLDLRALADVAQAVPPPVARRQVGRRRPRRPPVDPADPTAERQAFERWRLDVLNRRDDDTERSSEENDPAHIETNTDDTVALLETRDEERQDVPLICNDGYEADPETEDRPVGSGEDEDVASTGSGSASASSSSPTRDVDEPEEGEECSHSPPRPRTDPAPVTPARAANTCVTLDTPARPTRPRRGDTTDTPRRTVRNKSFDNSEYGLRSRPNNIKHHTKKDKGSKRRERVTASPPRSPARVAEARGCAGGAGGVGGAGALRWGESWSSVVAARPAHAHAPPHAHPLAPIGSDVRRRADPVHPPPRPHTAHPVHPAHPPPSDNSLFYFNGDPTHTAPRDVDFTWRPPPQLERPAFSPQRDYIDEPAAVGNNSYRLLNSVWGASLEPRPTAAAWLWGGLGAETGVRPPPGFGAPPRPVRPYDPFRSLASIWAPGALDWRADTPPPPSPDEPHK